jgi:hypothetical protein
MLFLVRFIPEQGEVDRPVLVPWDKNRSMTEQ